MPLAQIVAGAAGVVSVGERTSAESTSVRLITPDGLPLTASTQYILCARSSASLVMTLPRESPSLHVRTGRAASKARPYSSRTSPAHGTDGTRLAAPAAVWEVAEGCTIMGRDAATSERRIGVVSPGVVGPSPAAGAGAVVHECL